MSNYRMIPCRCFWCKNANGNTYAQTAGDGTDPSLKFMIRDYTACKKCQAVWDQGILCVEVTPMTDDTGPEMDVGSGFAPTGAWAVATAKSLADCGIDAETIEALSLPGGRFMLNAELFDALFPNADPPQHCESWSPPNRLEVN